MLQHDHVGSMLAQRPGLLLADDLHPRQRRAEAPRRRQMLRMLTQGRPHVLAAEAAREVMDELAGETALA